MEGADNGFIFRKERVYPRGKTYQRFFPINSMIQLGSSIWPSLVDEVFNELFQNTVWIFEEDDLFLFCHEIVPLMLFHLSYIKAALFMNPRPFATAFLYRQFSIIGG